MSLAFRTAPRISPVRFRRVLEEATSPLLADAIKAYGKCVVEDLDPAIILGMACVESRYGTRFNLDPVGNKNILNIRNKPEYPKGRNGYARFPSWYEGWAAAVERIATNPLYANLLTVFGLISVWAPSTENDTQTYISTVERLVNEWEGMNVAIETWPTTADFKYPVRQHRAGDYGGRRALNALRWFIVHDTEGVNSEGILTDPGPPIESAHALIARTGAIVAMLPLEVTAWTPGNDDVAAVSVNVELEGYSRDGYTDAQYDSLADYFCWCQQKGVNIPPEYVGKDERPGIIGHGDVADPSGDGSWGGSGGHTDPGPLFDWDKLTALVRGEQAPDDPYAEAKVAIDEWLAATDLATRGETEGAFLWHTLDGNTKYGLVCERVAVCYWPSNPDGWKVQGMLRGEFEHEEAAGRIQRL